MLLCRVATLYPFLSPTPSSLLLSSGLKYRKFDYPEEIKYFISDYITTNIAKYFLFSSVAQLCLTLCDSMDCSTPGLPVHHQLPEHAQTHVHWLVMPSNHLILCCPLLLLPSIFPSIRVFSNESVFNIRSQSIGVSASVSVLPMNIQD